MSVGVPKTETVDDRLVPYLARRIEAHALERTRRIAASTGEPLAVLVLKLGLMSERDLADALAELYGLPLVGRDDWPHEALFADRLSSRFLTEVRVVPLGIREGKVRLAMADPSDDYARQAVALVAGWPVTPLVATPGAIERAIAELYGSGDESTEALPADLAQDVDIERLKDLASEAPVIRLVNRIIAHAVDTRASDIHLEALEDRLRLRYRIDGRLVESDEAPPRQLAAAIVSRIKIIARLNIAERRLPQDGRIKIAVRGTPVDLRVATLPTLFGESVVMRVLDQDSVALDFAELGLSPDAIARLTTALETPNGIFLVTGPTGSGKTTTLYAGLKRLNTTAEKIVTVEDPVEYQLSGINQVQVHPSIGLDFAQTLRAILRNDPDIVLVGEIRDLETAEVAAQAALTGHLVLSTLHTNSAATSITRLRDMGLQEYLIAATLNGAAAQRLVRRLCPHCRRAQSPDAALVERLGLDRLSDTPMLFEPQGCADCDGRGYRGRSAVIEVLHVDDDTRSLILRGASGGEIEADARAKGMRTLREDALARALDGTTSLAEVLRVTGRA